MRITVSNQHIKRGIKGSNDRNPVSLGIADAVHKQLKRDVKVYVSGNDMVFVDGVPFYLEKAADEPDGHKVISKPGKVAQFLLDFDAGLDVEGMAFDIHGLEKLPAPVSRNMVPKG